MHCVAINSILSYDPYQSTGGTSSSFLTGYWIAILPQHWMNGELMTKGNSCKLYFKRVEFGCDCVDIYIILVVKLIAPIWRNIWTLDDKVISRLDVIFLSPVLAVKAKQSPWYLCSFENKRSYPIGRQILNTKQNCFLNEYFMSVIDYNSHYQFSLKKISLRKTLYIFACCL